MWETFRVFLYVLYVWNGSIDIIVKEQGDIKTCMQQAAVIQQQAEDNGYHVLQAGCYQVSRKNEDARMRYRDE